MTMKSDTNLERNRLVVSKLTLGIWQIFTLALESLKNFPFTGFLLNKVYIVWAKKVQRSYLSWHWRAMQNLKKNWLVVWEMTRGIWQIFTDHLNVSKLELGWDTFVKSRKCLSLKFTEELCVMTRKNDAKFEEELTCHFQIDRNLTNFDSNTLKIWKIWPLIRSFDECK